MTHLFFALLGIAALALTARVIWPLRRASPRLFTALILSAPLLLIALYQMTGTPMALAPGAAQPPVDEMPHSLDAAIAQLEQSLQQHPDQPEGWALLARSYTAQGQFTRARDAWARALALAPDDPIFLTETAQARAQAHPQNLLDADTVQLLERALTLQPDNQRARWLSGVAQRQRGEDAAAARTWEQLLPLVEASTAASLRIQIDEARRAAKLPPLAQDRPSPAAPANAHNLRVHVSLAPALAARTDLDPNATVFVFARIPDGPPMPIAVQRLRLIDLPTTLTLDDSSSPMPTQTLSDLGAAEVLARLSSSGSAVRQDADIDSAVTRISLPHAQTITLVIGDPP